MKEKSKKLLKIVPGILVLVIGIMILAFFIIKWIWAWTIPDLFPGAVEQGLIAREISWLTSFKLALFFAALGGAINNSNKDKLKCKAIVGAANNQLEDSSLSVWLNNNNIVYSPDYLVNSGGVMAIASEINKTEYLLDNKLQKIANRLRVVFEESKKNNESTDFVARQIAMERINS